MDPSDRSLSEKARSFLARFRRLLWVGGVLVVVGLAVGMGWSRGWFPFGPKDTSSRADPYVEAKTSLVSNLQAFSPERIVWSTEAPNVEPVEGILGSVHRIFKHKNNIFISDVTFSPSGDRILASVSEAPAKLWSASSGVLLQTFPHGGNFPSVAFSPSGDRVLTGKPTYRDVKSEAKLWDASTGEHLQTFPHENGVLAVAFSPSGERVLTGRESPRGKESEAKLWDASTGELLRSFSHPGDVRAVAFSSTGDKILVGGFDRVRLWSVSGDFLQTFSQPQSILDVEFSPTGDRVLAGGNDGARLWSASSGELVQTFKHKLGFGVVDVEFSPLGDRVLTAGRSGAHLWSVLTGELLQTLPHSESVYGVAFGPSSDRILTASYDTVRLWRIPSQKRGLGLVQELVNRRLEEMKADYTALPDTLIAGQRQLLRRKRTLQKSAPEYPEVPVVTCGETVSQHDCQKRKQTARSRYETKREAFRQAFDTYTDKIRPLNQTIALLRERMYRFYEDRIKPRLIHKIFLQVFGDPWLKSVRYDADRQTYVVDLVGSRTTAGGYKRTLAVQTSRDTVAEDKNFKEKLEGSAPVVQWNITSKGVEWDTAWTKLDQKRLTLVPVGCPSSPGGVEATVTARVKFLPDTEAFVYRYAVANRISSLREVDAWAVRFSKLHSTTDYTAHTRRDHQAPEGWFGLTIGDKEIFRWEVGIPFHKDTPDGEVPQVKSQIKPGDTLSGFGFESFNAPGPQNAWVSGVVPLPLAQFENEAEAISVLCPNVKGSSWLQRAHKLSTVGPALDTRVDIDIKPGSDSNVVSLNNQDLVPVAFLGSERISVDKVSDTKAFFGITMTEPVRSGEIEDVNNDGHGDLVFHFPIAATGITKDTEKAALSVNLTVSEAVVWGTDTVKVVGPPGKGKEGSSKTPKRGKGSQSGRP